MVPAYHDRAGSAEHLFGMVVAMGVAVLRERAVDLDGLRRAAEQAAPVSLAGERVLPVLDALASLLPAGLRRGVTATVEGGPGSTSLALALGAAASAAGS